MSPALNIRHRTSATHDGDSPSKRIDSAGDSESKEKRAKLLSKDTRIALAAVVCFLIIGLFAGYFLLHHQHRKVIWGNGMHEIGTLHKAKIRAQGPPHFVTIVLPSVVNPPGRQKRLQAIAETWGPTSRAVFVVHNVSEYPELSNEIISLDSVDVASRWSYPKLLLVPSSISPDDGVPRLNYVIRTVFKQVNPKFAFFVNDHTYVIPEHLCTFLSDKDSTQSMYVGHALRQEKDYFNSGAAGYVLSRHSMKSMVDKWDEEDTTCLVKNGEEWLQGNPGLVTAKCLIHVLKTPSVDSREEKKWHRFHAFGLVRSVAGKVDQWYINKHQDMDKILGTDASYNTLLNGTDCCSKETISFHYVEHLETRALFATRQALLLNPNLSDSELKALMIREWPKTHKETGYYSHVLPDDSDVQAWDPLLRVMRKISSKLLEYEC